MQKPLYFLITLPFSFNITRKQVENMLLAALFVAGIALTIATAGFFGVTEVWSALAGSNLGIAALAVLAQLASLALLGVRLKVISRKYGGISYWRAFKVMTVSVVTDFLTPVAKVGGEPVKIMMMQKRFGGSRASAIVAIDTLVELITSLAAVLLILFFLGGKMPAFIATALFLFVIFVLIAVAIAYKLMTSKRWLRGLINWIIKKISKFKKIEKKDYSASFIRAVKILAKDKTTMFGAMAVSFIQKILEFARIWLVFLAIGLVLPWEIVLIIWAFALVLFLIPWLPGNLGLIEFGTAGALTLLGVVGTAAAGGVLLDRFISFWLVLIIGLAFASHSGLGLSAKTGIAKKQAKQKFGGGRKNSR